MPIRNLQREDIEFALGLVHREGWLYHRVELERMIEMDPEGSFVYEDEGPLGFVTCVTYPRTCVIGHLVVSESARGRKIGQMLVKRAVEYASERGKESVLLFATDEVAGVYRKHGFRPQFEVFCIQAQKRGPVAPQERPELSAMLEQDLERIGEMDAMIFGDDRSKLLARLYHDYPGLCFKIERSGKILGYSFGRTTTAANDFGPWVCTSGLESDERALFDSVASRLDDRSIFMGVFVKNESALRLVSRLKRLRTWRTQLMVRGKERYTGQTEHSLGLIGFELG